METTDLLALLGSTALRDQQVARERKAFQEYRELQVRKERREQLVKSDLLGRLACQALPALREMVEQRGRKVGKESEALRDYRESQAKLAQWERQGILVYKV